MSRTRALVRLIEDLVDRNFPVEEVLATTIQRALEQTPYQRMSKRSAIYHQIRSALIDGPMTVANIADAIGRPRRWTNRAIAWMRGNGLIYRIGHGVYGLRPDAEMIPLITRPITSTHPRAAYWREWKRKKAKESIHA